MYKKILVPLALDHGISKQTLSIAKKLAAADAKITALYVYEMPQGSVDAYLGQDFIAKGVERAQEILAEKIASEEGVTGEIIRGHAYRTIVDYAVSNSFDCIVIGSHKPELSDYLIGSTAARVVRQASCAVHVHRAT